MLFRLMNYFRLVLLCTVVMLSACKNRKVTDDILSDQTASGTLTAEVYNDSARLLLTSNRINEALSAINKALTLDADNPELFVTLSDIYLGMNNPAKAKEALNKATDLDPLDPVPWFKQGYLHLVLQDHSLAREYLKKAAALRPVYPEASFHLGLSYLETGDTNQAVEAFQTAVLQDQQYRDAFIMLGSIMSERNPEVAAGYYQNAIRIDSTDTQVQYNLGMLYQESGDDARATDMYQRILAIDSSYFPASYNLGYIYLVKQENYREAIRFFDHTLRMNPSYVDAMYNRGLCYEILNEKARAQRDYQEALRLSPNYPRAVEGMNRLDD
ncbi:MAG: tetratricopeptide repeat protein [Bacteroidales bacterium]|nr:tetratricopeptide repeat protein [Lentimicrobiaceae bacterium]MDD5694690.1 tetratricopeptide repeat protein [Bacteroidales bacterium]